MTPQHKRTFFLCNIKHAYADNMGILCTHERRANVRPVKRHNVLCYQDMLQERCWRVLCKRVILRSRAIHCAWGDVTERNKLRDYPPEGRVRHHPVQCMIAPTKRNT